MFYAETLRAFKQIAQIKMRRICRLAGAALERYRE
jgi:hypothetical protein